MWKQAGLALLSVGLLGGCYEGGEQFGDVDARAVTVNGVSLNGLSLNGLSLNGLSLNGLSLNGLSLNGLSLNGLSLNGLSLNGLSLNGLSLNGTDFVGVVEDDGVWQERSGEQLIGMVFSLELDVEGESVPLDLMIEDRYVDIDSGFDDIQLYELRVRVAGSDDWIDPCQDEDGVGHPAIPLQNYWDTESGDRIDDADVISWSCTTGVLAHCVQWGYRPWAEAEDCKKKDKKGKWKKCKDVSLRDHHQACTRMARADYCGDGDTWTITGTQIDIWDNLEPQLQARAGDWDIEAEWTPEGAWCLSDIRQQAWKDEGLYPSCGKKKDKRWDRRASKCGKLKNRRSLLVSSFNGDI